MCGRFWIEFEGAELKGIILAAQQMNPQMKAFGEVFPGDIAPVVAKNRKLQRAAFPMLWEFPVFAGKSVINIRGETASEKPAFQKSAAERRCAVPASWYFEWTPPVNEGKRVKYRFFYDDGSPLYLAGLYTHTPKGAAFAILTRPAEGVCAAVHHRMPVIVPKPSIDDWIFGELNLDLLVYGKAPKLEFDLAEPAV
ncbi:MAG: SOS response-associated peptidase [Christensenellales bacterium]|jgi:putative SOS response-associated peptidase YedK